MYSDSNFEHDLKNNEVPIAIDLVPDKHAVVIAFGGIAGGLGIPPFEFFKLTSELGINRIFLRDIHQAAYHQGLKGVTDNIDQTVVFLKNLIKEHEFEPVILIGNSMGGYAAVLFGALIEADVVHGFSCTTFLDRLHRLAYADLRFRSKISYIRNVPNVKKKYFDLKEVLRSMPHIKTKFMMHYSKKHRLDRAHSERMGKIRNVELYPYDLASHKLIKHLRETEQLQSILLNSLRQ